MLESSVLASLRCQARKDAADCIANITIATVTSSNTYTAPFLLRQTGFLTNPIFRVSFSNGKPHIRLAVLPGPQQVEYCVLVVRQDNVPSVIDFNDEMVTGFSRTELQVHHSINSQLMDTQETFITQVFATLEWVKTWDVFS